VVTYNDKQRSDEFCSNDKLYVYPDPWSGNMCHYSTDVDYGTSEYDSIVYSVRAILSRSYPGDVSINIE
jgi:hypothetical protein